MTIQTDRLFPRKDALGPPIPCFEVNHAFHQSDEAKIGKQTRRYFGVRSAGCWLE